MTGYQMNKMILKAKYIISSHSEIITDGYLTVNGSNIETVGKSEDLNNNESFNVIDFGNAAIMPGLINAHAHLELTDLYGIKIPDKKLTTWIWHLMRAKMKWKEQEYTNSLQNGIKQSLELGTTTVFDITNSGYAFSVLNGSNIRKVIFNEVIAFDPVHVSTVIESAKEKLTKINESNDLVRLGISPHAPYTVSSELYTACAELAKELKLPLCTHIAETKEEVEFLTKGTGLFTGFMAKLRLLPQDWQAPGETPVKFLAQTGLLKKKPLLIHCNYLTDEEILTIKESDSTVVYCPRSHHFFEHTDHPVKKLLENKINVAIGTDSLASNESLSILDEMKTLNNINQIPPQTIIKMATENGAAALDMDNMIGKIKPGYCADLSVISLPDQNDSDLYKALLSDKSTNILTMVNGVVCFDKLEFLK